MGINIRLIGILLLTVAPLVSVFSQENQEREEAPIDTTASTLNKRDARGRKTGTWFIRKEALRGEPAYVTFGDYRADKKQGVWYRLNVEGQLESALTYQAGLLHGTSRFYENGRLVTIGNYRSLDTSKKFDSVWVTDPITLLETLVAVPTESGTVKHGMWRYYNPHTGQLIREEQYQVDHLISRKDFTHRSHSDSLIIPKRVLPHQKSSDNQQEEVPKSLMERKF